MGIIFRFIGWTIGISLGTLSISALVQRLFQLAFHSLADDILYWYYQCAGFLYENVFKGWVIPWLDVPFPEWGMDALAVWVVMFGSAARALAHSNMTPNDRTKIWHRIDPEKHPLPEEEPMKFLVGALPFIFVFAGPIFVVLVFRYALASTPRNSRLRDTLNRDEEIELRLMDKTDRTDKEEPAEYLGL